MADKLKAFSVEGPYKVPLESGKNGKMVAKDLTKFWAGIGELRDRRGVYVFGVRAGKGITPIYVGKAAKQSFEDEAFTSHKRADHYNPALLDYRKGNPVVFLIAHPKTKGAVNKRLIDTVESFLIDVASTKNPDLSNIRKKPDHKWRIQGVVRARQGESKKKDAVAFKRAVGLI